MIRERFRPGVKETVRSIENERSLLNNFAWERVNQYRALKIGGHEIRTPFFSNDIGLIFGRMMTSAGMDREDITKVFNIYNNNEVPFGWYHGKGTPEQIAFAAEEIAGYYNLDLSRAESPEVIVEFMKSVGLGVDCSGFVFQTLSYSFNKLGHTPLEQNDQLMVAHSAIGQLPPGVHIDSLEIEKGEPQFEFKPNLTESWEQLYQEGRLEFRRLRIFAENDDFTTQNS